MTYLQLTQEEYDEAKQSNPTIHKHARETLEYGEGEEGYWTSERFMTQIREAARITDVSEVSNRRGMEGGVDIRPQQLSCSNARGCTRCVENECEPRRQAASDAR